MFFFLVGYLRVLAACDNKQRFKRLHHIIENNSIKKIQQSLHLKSSDPVEEITHLFVGGAASGHQVQVEPSETQNRDQKQSRYTDHHQTGNTDKENCFPVPSLTDKPPRQVTRIRDKAVQLPQVVHVVQDIHEAQGEHANHVNGE